MFCFDYKKFHVTISLSTYGILQFIITLGHIRNVNDIKITRTQHKCQAIYLYMIDRWLYLQLQNSYMYYSVKQLDEIKCH